MSSPPLCYEHPGASRDDIEALLKTFTRPQLEAKLRTVQLRLGSPHERPGDMDCAQLIAHQLNNVLTGEKAGEFIRDLDRFP